VEVRSVGRDALLIEVDDVEPWRALLEQRRTAGHLAAVEIVPGARTILLDGLKDRDSVAEFLMTCPQPAPIQPASGRLVEIPTLYDGPDLENVAGIWEMWPERAIAAIEAIEFRVAFFGFSPGFAYLSGLPAGMAVPRRGSPRPRVPAGSVALADTYAGIYPSASPGGWQLIGRTSASLFDVDGDPPALLSPGDRVRFRQVSA
jgi:KipI family sensor histidine kinase inhibitor